MRTSELCTFVLKLLMIQYAPAKINLGLHIKNKRPDGFRNIESVLYPVPLYDVLEFSPAEDFSLKTKGYPIPGIFQENTVWKAYHLMKSRFGLPGLAVRLVKNIPPGSGLGGPSSDAATFIKSVNTYFHLGLSLQMMLELAEQIGSDCLFFIRSVPAYATGKGELLQKISLSLKGYYLCIVFIQQPVSTAWAYAHVRPDKNSFSLQKLQQFPIEQWQDILINQFEPLVFGQFPQLAVIKENLIKSGAVYASMSGSGSAVYGIFKQKPALNKNLRDKQKWCLALV